jgi:serine/threonine protein kinase/Tol biopolymer transport system component
VSPTVGSRLGPYEILSAIGAGGMGEVYRARDTRLNRTVAVKVLSRHLSASPEVRQRFEREARTISQLSHPHVCALYDVGRDGDTDYLVMEYLEGETLSERLARGPLPLEQTVRYGVQIAEALEKAHRQGIVHRDLKPGNVMLTKTGVKLLDFGLAKAMAPAPAPSSLTALPTQQNLTQEGAILGTFQYMAPEQLEGKDADARSDIFALGAVIYEMVTGRKAFTGTSQASLISSILRDEPPSLAQVQPMTPAMLDRTVRTCLAKDPEDRWQSSADVARQLRWVGEGSESSLSVAAAPAAAPTRSRRVRPWIAAALLLLAGLLAGLLLRPRIDPRVAIHSSLVAPEGVPFRFEGDDAGPLELSPDGSRLVFGTGDKLWLQSLRTGAVAPVKGTEGGRYPFWSPDSRSLGFFADGKLKTMEISGGPAQVVCDAPNPRGGTWSAQGVIVFAPDVRSGLVRVDSGGGIPAPLTRLDAKLHTTHRWPLFLPDGRHLLYTAGSHESPHSPDSGIYAVSIDGKENRRILPNFGSAVYASGVLLFVREANLMAQPFDAARQTLSGQPALIAGDVQLDTRTWHGNFTVSQTGLLAYELAQPGGGGQLTWFDLAGKHLKEIGENSDAYAPKLSPDGKRASVVVGDPNNDIWIYELERGVKTRLTTEGQIILSPVWSPDGSRILYVRQTGSADYTIHTTRSDGAGDRKTIFKSSARLEPTDWSRDGRYVLCTRGTIPTDDIVVIPVDEPEKMFPIVHSNFNEMSAQFSPDGRWIAYVSRETGRDEVYVTSFPSGGAKWQVSAAGGRQPRWSPDGKALYFESPRGELVAAAVEARGAAFEVRSLNPLFRTNMYVGPRVGVPAYDVAPDGARLLINNAGDPTPIRATLVVNWDANVPK